MFWRCDVFLSWYNIIIIIIIISIISWPALPHAPRFYVLAFLSHLASGFHKHDVSTFYKYKYDIDDHLACFHKHNNDVSVSPIVRGPICPDPARTLFYDENGRKWMKMDKNGWKWMKMDESGWKWIKVDEMDARLIQDASSKVKTRSGSFSSCSWDTSRLLYPITWKDVLIFFL